MVDNSTKLLFEMCRKMEKREFKKCFYMSILSLARTFIILKRVSKNSKIEETQLLYRMFDTNYINIVNGRDYNEEVNEACSFCYDLSDRIEEIYFNADEDDEKELPLLNSYYELMEGWYYFLGYICKKENYTVSGFVNLVIFLPLKIIENFVCYQLPYDGQSKEMDEAIAKNILYTKEIDRLYNDMKIVEECSNEPETIINLVRKYMCLDIVS